MQSRGREVTIYYQTSNANQFLNVRFTNLMGGRLDIEGVALAPAPIAASFETDPDPTKSVYTVTLDNPLTFGNVGLSPVNTQWAGGVVAEEVESVGAGFVNYNIDLNYFTSGGQGAAASNGLASVGAVDDQYYAWPNATGTWSASANATFSGNGRGIRVGYAPLTVELRASHPDDTLTTLGAPVTVQLAPTVELVPFQVAVFYSNNIPRETNLTQQLAFFDQIHYSEKTTFTDGSTQEMTSVQHGFTALPGAPYAPTQWMNPNSDGYYASMGDYTPDSVFASCGIQFRLINYFEILTDDKHVAPAVKLPNDPDETPTHFPFGTSDSTPCYNNRDAAQADPRFVPDVPLLIYMRRSGFSNSPEDGRALPGSRTACVRRNAGVTVIAHEIGHILGLGDCGNCSAAGCNLMCSAGGGAAPPTASECASAKTAAHTISLAAFPR